MNDVMKQFLCTRKMQYVFTLYKADLNCRCWVHKDMGIPEGLWRVTIGFRMFALLKTSSLTCDYIPHLNSGDSGFDAAV